jgi:nicotinamidase-related amidase
VKDALLLVDVLSDFRHEDGERLLESFRERREGMLRALSEARDEGVPVVYAQDNRGVWDGDAPRLAREALDGPGGELLEPLRRKAMTASSSSRATRPSTRRRWSSFCATSTWSVRS